MRPLAAGTSTLPAGGDDNITYAETVYPAVCVYVVWWVAHTAWLLLHGRHHGHPQSSHDTVFHLTMKNVTPFAAFCGFEAGGWGL